MLKFQLPENFSLGTKVTWSSQNRSSWINLLEAKLGTGPFEVIDIESSYFIPPKVMIADRSIDRPLAQPSGNPFFDKSWLEEWKE